MSTNWRKARLAPAEYAMLEFCEKLTLLPSGVEEADIAGLRRQGFSDREILSLTLAAAYRNFITRVADALGVELRKTGVYTSEVLKAFGVSEEEARTTMYADRVAAPERAEGISHPESGGGSVSFAAGLECWIDSTPADGGGFTELCREAERLTGSHPMRNLALAFALRPEALQATLEFGRPLGLGGSGLSARLGGIIGLVVAARLWLPYAGVHHAQAILDAGGSADEVEALVRDPSGGSLTGAELAVACFCEKVTRQPSAMARSDVESLRSSGFDDSEIVTIAARAAFENFLGRAAAGLGVRLENNLAPVALRAFQVEVSP